MLVAVPIAATHIDRDAARAENDVYATAGPRDDKLV
jgi:hypothetical protein